jgi:hypothetical protein
MVIECNEISQTVNELLIAFADCNKIKNSDLRRLVELVSAVNTCSNGGADYNTLTTNTYTPVSDTVITYPINDFHAISILVVVGEAVYQGVTFPVGGKVELEFTNLNQQALSFTAKAGSTIFVERIIETI